MQSFDDIKNHALELMKAHGFPITEEIFIAVDEKLPFMGYTTVRNGKPLIVISKWSIATDMVMGLIFHELGHVYMTEINHPSHDYLLHKKVIDNIWQEKEMYSYQADIIHSIINNIQDLYADDISFPVYINDSGKSDLSEFFLGWIRKPILSPTSKEEAWENAEALLSAAFAKANLKRHKATDTDGKIEKAVQLFLSKLPPKLAKKFNYFEDAMVNLPAKTTDVKFRKLLDEYLREFLKLTETPQN
jgi:hypothetical protein